MRCASAPLGEAADGRRVAGCVLRGGTGEHRCRYADGGPGGSGRAPASRGAPDGSDADADEQRRWLGAAPASQPGDAPVG